MWIGEGGVKPVAIKYRMLQIFYQSETHPSPGLPLDRSLSNPTLAMAEASTWKQCAYCISESRFRKSLEGVIGFFCFPKASNPRRDVSDVDKAVRENA